MKDRLARVDPILHSKYLEPTISGRRTLRGALQAVAITQAPLLAARQSEDEEPSEVQRGDPVVRWVVVLVESAVPDPPVAAGEPRDRPFHHRPVPAVDLLKILGFGLPAGGSLEIPVTAGKSFGDLVGVPLGSRVLVQLPTTTNAKTGKPVPATASVLDLLAEAS